MWFERLQRIDRRVMYLLLVAAIAAPLVWQIRLPVMVSPAAQGAYDTVQNMPSDKIAILSINWASGTLAESIPQTEALVRHMFRDKKRFAILSWDPQGAKFAHDIANRVSKELHKQYGTDWVDIGYRPYSSFVVVVQGIGRDIPNTLKSDMYGTSLSKIPMMKDVKDVKDVGLVIEVTSSATINTWIAYIHGFYRTPVIFAPVSLFAPEGFNYLDAGQIQGMLVGMKGAAEYEKLLGREGFATRGAGALSSSQLLIMILIVLGNAGYIASRRRRAGSRS